VRFNPSRAIHSLRGKADLFSPLKNPKGVRLKCDWPLVDIILSGSTIARFSKKRPRSRLDQPPRDNDSQHRRLLTKMSRFFHGDSSSESSSSDEEELYSEEEEEEQAGSDEEESDEDGEGESDEASSDDEEGGKQKGINRFIKGEGDSESEESSDEDRAKVVKSAKDKRLEELESTVKAIENGQKINDWGSISTGMYFVMGRMRWWTGLTFFAQNSTSSTDKL
jgi:hypothetical protein